MPNTYGGYTPTPANADLDNLPQHTPSDGRQVQPLGAYLGNNQVYDPRDWGASANGAADDQAFIQSAHDKAVVRLGECVLSRGTYRATGARNYAGGVTIRRGAMLKAAAGAVLTIGKLAAGLHQVFDVSENATGIRFAADAVPEIWIEWFGASPSAAAAVNQAALRAAIAALPADSANIAIRQGPGTYQWGQGDADGISGRLQRSGVRSIASGMDRTINQYSSAGANGNYGPGSWWLVNLTVPVANYDQLLWQDCTYQDLNTGFIPLVGHIPAAIDGQGIVNAAVRRCKFMDVKGNSAINLNGDAASNTTAGTGTIEIDGCIGVGTNPTGTGYIQGDFINVSHFGTVWIHHTRSLACCLRHAVEGGTGVGDVIIENCWLDMGVGTFSSGSCIAAFTALNSMSVKQNYFYNWTNNGGAYGISLATDTPGFPCNNVTISQNFFYDRQSGNAAILFQTVSPYYSNVQIRDNDFNCGSAIAYLATNLPTVDFGIENNKLILTTFGNRLMSITVGAPGPTFLNATDALRIGSNSITGRSVVTDVLDWATWTAVAHSTQVKLRRNHHFQAFNGSACGFLGVGASFTMAAPLGSKSATAQLTMNGVIPGDKINIHPDPNSNVTDGVILHAWCSANDIVKYFAVNYTGGALGPITYNFSISIGDRY